MTGTATARTGRSAMLWGAALLVCVALPAGCARNRPAMAPRAVALEMPPPPARVISTPPEPVVPTEATTVDRPAPASRPARSTRAAPSRPDTKPVEPPRAETADVAPAPAAAPAEPTAQGPLLRTPQTADESHAERQTREVLGRAAKLLDGVNPTRLGAQARQQHETARRFVDQSLQALTDRNYLLAASLADKAETLARGLSR